MGQTEQDTQESNFNSNQSSQDSLSSGDSSAPVSGLSDADYEFLFNQLLEGIAHGWQDRRIVKFFKQLGDRGKQADWVAWLERLQDKLLKLPVESKRQLGTIMIRFGELTRSAPEVKQIGATSYRLGRELIFGGNVSTIWEYVGPDAIETKQIETEELSQRLPNDFTALGDKHEERSVTVTEPLVGNNTHNELESQTDEKINSAFEAENRLEVEEVAPLSDREDTFLEPLVSADELWADDVSTAESDAIEEEDPNLDSDLNRNSIESVSSYDEEFELDSRSSVSEVESSADIVEPAVEHKVAADLQSELPISNSDRLSGLLETFDLNSASEFSETAESKSIPNRSPDKIELESPTAPTLDSTSERHNKGLSTVTTSELDDSSLELIESWFNLGLKQVSAGEYSKAIASWDKALGINANLPEAWHNRGSALGRLGNYEAAVKSFQNALEIDPNNYQAWNDRAHALYQLQDWSGAVESWTEAIKIVPGNHLFWYNRGCSLEQLAKWNEAIASYEKALEIKPDFQPGRSRYINLIADNSRSN